MVKLEFSLDDGQKERVRSVITRVPKNEEEVKRIFFQLEETLGFEDVRVYSPATYPDASSFFRDKEAFMEFEHHSSEFRKHKHDEEKCNLIICWEDDDDSLKIPVVELSTLADNWLEARQMAMLRFPFEQTSAEDIEKGRELMDRFNFDIYDAVGCKTGTTKEGVRRYYGRSWEERTPECLGGPLECVKRDIEVKHANIGLDSEGIASAVVCKQCGNKDVCTLGGQTDLGHVFIFVGHEKRPRRINIRRFSIEDEKTLSYMKETKHNPWKGIHFKRS